MTVDIHRDHAILHTVSVDVSVLRISNRQVTLSVFKQLDERKVLDTDGSLNGVTWGSVKYKWEETPAWADYYVVWQDRTNLLRCPFPLVKSLQNKYQKKVLSSNGKYTYFRTEVCQGFTEWFYDCEAIYAWQLLESRQDKYLNLVEHMHIFEKLDQLFIAT
jgi:hypothetical protein